MEQPGLVNQQQPTQQQPTQPQEEPGVRVEQPPTNEGSEPSAEEQKGYDGVINAAAGILYEGQASDDIVGMLQQGAANLPQTIAKITTTVITEIDKQSGEQIPETVIVPAAMEIMLMVADMAQTMGVAQVDEQLEAQAWQNTLLSVAEQYDIDPADIQAGMEGMEPEMMQQVGAQQGAFAEAGMPQGQPQGQPQGPPQDPGMVQQQQQPGVV